MAEGHADPKRVGGISGDPSAAPLNARSTDSDQEESFADRLIVNPGQDRRFDLTLAHGDITQVDACCYVVGLFKAVAPSGAVSALDRAMDGGISELIARRMFSA